MKKTLLLASVACLISVSANANMWHDVTKNMDPYIGADYVYSNLDVKGKAKHVEKNFNSALLNAGVNIGEHFGLEAFYQMGGSRKSHHDGVSKKFKFNAYGLDAYGYMPLGCAKKFSLVGTAGMAVYDTQLKYEGKHDKSKVGYRVGGGMQYKLTDHVSARVIGRYGYIGAKELNHVAEVAAGLRYSF